VSADRVLAMVLAGGEGTRLAPLTAVRSKPAVPFGARYRIVDFVLSNLVNSEIYSIYMLVQYKSQPLIEHIRNAWVLAPILPNHFVTVVPPQMRAGPEWFQGTADAVYQNLELLEVQAPGLVVVFGADHIYRMDVRAMIEFHRSRRADVTVAALPVPLAAASAFGIIDCDPDLRVERFTEKPDEPASIPGDPEHAFASMGNYVFDARLLVEALRESHALGEKDFGRDVLPRLARSHRVYAYDFMQNRVPGVRRQEERAYWRDVGTVDAFFAANMDILGPSPHFNLFNPRWPIRSSNYQGPATQILAGNIERSQIGPGTLIRGGTIRESIVRREVVIEDDVVLERCVVMDHCVIRRGARLRNTIVDRYNTIAPGARIGYEADADAKRYHVSEGGVVVVPMAPVRQDTHLYE
jgi:glucose-1-phosphate adenylyltransferase